MQPYTIRGHSWRAKFILFGLFANYSGCHAQEDREGASERKREEEEAALLSYGEGDGKGASFFAHSLVLPHCHKVQQNQSPAYAFALLR